MLKLDLARLERDRRLPVDAEIPPDDTLWEGAELTFRGPVRVSLTASFAGGGEVVVRGSVDGTLNLECRRCLDPVEVPVERVVTLVWTPADELGQGGEDGDSRIVEATALELDLGDAIREELILGTDRYVVCDGECRGLCPQCGVNLNLEQCGCVVEEQDPRWEILRTMKTEK